MRIELSDDELLLLDGKLDDKRQLDIEAAKERIAMRQAIPGLSPALAGFVANVVRAAENEGELCFERKSLRHCAVCDKSAGYQTYPRNGRHHRKGDKNFDKPLTFQGVDIARRFISIQGHANLGCCNACWEVVKPHLAEKLAGVRAAIPEAITGVAPRFKRYTNQECVKCGWKGHEGQMGMLPALMGGLYSGKCPQCEASNVLFGPTLIKTAPGFVVVEIEATKKQA